MDDDPAARGGMSTMEFGIWDQFRMWEMRQFATAADAYECHIRQAQLAERVGFRYFFTIEHQGSHVGQITSPSVFLTALAQHTSTLRLGTMIWQLPFHNPMRLAQEVAMLDQLSRGRAEFGTGIGVTEHEFIRLGVNFYDRQEMGEEALEIIKRAWTQDSVTYEGKFWRFDEALPAPKPYQRPHPPIWAAAHSPRALAFAAKNNYHVGLNIDVDETMVEKCAYYRKVWRESGHSGPMPRIFLMRTVHVAETDAKAREQVEPYLLGSYRLGRDIIERTRVGFGASPRGVGLEDTPDIRERGRVMRGMSSSYDFWMESGVGVIGSPETVIKKIKEQQTSMGLDVYAGSFHIGAMPYELVDRSIELFGKEVIPAFE